MERGITDPLFKFVSMTAEVDGAIDDDNDDNDGVADEGM